MLRIANEYFGPDLDDRVAAGMEGLITALNRHSLRRLNGFAAYAEDWIRKYVRLEVKQWRRGGEAGETRAEQANPHTNWHESYNAIEGLQDDDENGNPKPGQGFIAADDGASIDDTQRLINLRLIKIGRNLGAPRECWEVDGDPRRNGGRWPRKKVRQIRHYRPAGWQGPELPPLPVREYVKKYPTPKKHLINPPRGNASALGVIGWLAKGAVFNPRSLLPPAPALPPYAYTISVNTAATAQPEPKFYGWKYDDPAAPLPRVWSEKDKRGLLRVIGRTEPPSEPTGVIPAPRGWQIRGSAPPNHTLVRTIYIYDNTTRRAVAA